jgi:hypothetical protein
VGDRLLSRKDLVKAVRDIKNSPQRRKDRKGKKRR